MPHSLPKPPAKLAPPSLPTGPSRPSPMTRRTPKTFVVQTWTGANEGEKIILYGPSGMGKTTLATMAPNPVFIGLDDGARKIRHPKTGEPVQAILGVETWEDLRDALHQDSLFPSGSTIVLDTVTNADPLAEGFVLRTIPNDRGETMPNLIAYGYGKGEAHVCNTMRLLLSDLDPHVKRGVNVLLLAQQAQVTISNTAGLDYLEDGPAIRHVKSTGGARGEFIGWCDHVFRIGHPDVTVVAANQLAKKGKVTGGSTERIIFTTKEIYFAAKNRGNGRIPDAVTFSEPGDDSIWQYVFGEKA